MRVYHTTHISDSLKIWKLMFCLWFLNLRTFKAQKHNTMYSSSLLFYYTWRAITVTTKSYKIGKKHPQNFSPHDTS